MRDLHLTPGFLRNAYASVLVEQGSTRLICTASVEETVPKWMEGKGKGWVTAEYAMLPASTGQRRPRDTSKGKVDGRSVEIQRLIGRSLRAVVDRSALGERSIAIDCDVIDADGGTRCAAISGGYVAMQLAMQRLVDEGLIPALPLTDSVAAVSVGVVRGELTLDLDYERDSNADVDMNVVMTGSGRLIEVQATGERDTFDRAQLDSLLDLAAEGCTKIGIAQRAACEAG
jgi:ribonuclease PH